MQFNIFINKTTQKYVFGVLTVLALAIFIGSQYFLQGGQPTEYDTRAAALGSETILPSSTIAPSLPLKQLLNGPISLRHFSWTGVPQRAFTDEEIEKIATQSTIEIIPKFHAQWNYSQHHTDATRLKQKNPNIKILVYQSARFIFPKEKDYLYQMGFKDEWLFLDKDGLPISLSEDKEQIEYVDVANPEYRAWVIQKLRNYFAAGPYEGIALDSARFIADGNTPTRKNAYTNIWKNLLSYDPVIAQQRIDTWNQGMRILLQEIKTAFPDKIVLYNGFADKAISSNRNLELFQYADMGLNEDFCIAGPIDTRIYLTPDQVQADLNLMMQYTKRDQGKTLLQKVNFSNARNADEFGKQYEDMARYCYGIFMLGAYADRTYFKIGGFYNVEEVDQYVVESKIRLGVQKSDYLRMGDKWNDKFG